MDDIYDPPIEPVYPELLLFPVARSIRAASKLLQGIARRINAEESPQDIFKRPEGVPDDWVEKPANKGDGVKYVDPKNNGNDVRISRGDPKSTNAGQQRDNIKWKKNGQWLDKNGNPVVRNSEESHIRLEDFKFNKDLFK